MKMQNYDITVVDKNKRTKNIEVTAENYNKAKSQAMSSGSVIKIKKKRGLSFGERLSSSERYIFLNVLSTMLGSKVQSSEALRLLSDTYKGRIGSVSRKMKKRLEAGRGIGEAMEDLGQNVFPDSIVALVKAGSDGGSTADALLEAAKFEQELNDIKKESSKGMVSAILSFLIAGAFLLASSFYMSPKIKNSPLFSTSSVDTSLVDMLANVLGWVMLFIMIFFTLLLFLGSFFRALFPNFCDAIILKIPFYRDIILSKQSYATLYGLSMLLGTGVSIESSLKITGDNSKRGALKTDLLSALKAIRSGNANWPDFMSNTFTPTDRASLKMAATREDISRILKTLSIQNRRLYGNRLQIIVPTMTLISAMLLTITGAIMFAQIILPMLELTRSF